MNRRLLPLLALAALLVRAEPSHAAGGLAIAGEAAETLHALINQWNLEVNQQVNNDKNRMQLFNNLRRAADDLRPIKQTTQTSSAALDARLRTMLTEHGTDPVSDWSAKDRAEYEKTNRAREDLTKVEKGLGDAWESLKWLQARQNVEGFNPFGNAAFKERLKQLGSQVEQVATTYKGFGDQFSIEAGAGDPGSNAVVADTGFASASNPSTEMVFEVNGTRLEPGAKGVAIRLGAGRSVKVRAIAWDSVRQGIVAAAKRLESGEMAQAKVREKDLPYMLHYGTSQLATLTRTESESYAWTPGSQVQRVIGKQSQWGQSSIVISAPTFSSGRDGSTDDVLSWSVPAVDTGSVEFGFEVIATVRWSIGREAAGGKVTTREDSTIPSGTLILTARAR